MTTREFPAMREYPFKLKVPIIASPSELAAILAELQKTNFYKSISMTLQFYVEEGYKMKWEIWFCAADKESFDMMVRQLPSVVNAAWYGAGWSERDPVELYKTCPQLE